MKYSLLKLYHALPSPLRSCAASAHGWRLRAWRYGRETDLLVEAAAARETWTAVDWAMWQKIRLDTILSKAIKSVPFYRELWRRQKITSGRGSSEKQGVVGRAGVPEQPWRELENWPVLKKEDVRKCPEAFMAEGTDRRRMLCEHTSGTTGTPLTLWQSRETVREWYGLMEVRWRRWNGLSRSNRWAMLGGQLIVPIRQAKAPFWVWNSGLNQLYMSSYHLSRETCASYLEAMRRSRVVYVWGYASSLYSLALFAEQLQLDVPPLKVVISNAEPLFAHQRELIGRVFRCPIRDTYGMSEMVCGASECDAGTMHLWPEAGVYEVLCEDADKPVRLGQPGRLVCTGLLNSDMLLIRYEVGDRVAIASPDVRCSCGRNLPIVLSIEGRNDDTVLALDGRRVGRLDPVFKSDIPIQEAQIVQEALDFFRVLIIATPSFTFAHERALVSALQERVGTVRVQVERVASIPRSANGKFRAVISRVGSRIQSDPMEGGAQAGADTGARSNDL